MRCIMRTITSKIFNPPQLNQSEKERNSTRNFMEKKENNVNHIKCPLRCNIL